MIVDYVVEVLSSLKDLEESSFDVEELCEMIAAYVPEFTQVNRYGLTCGNKVFWGHVG